jgi:phosphoenolpyruvate carboxykinase (GTP)
MARAFSPNNNWMSPDEAKARMMPCSKGCMKGRTLYVSALLHGPDRLAVFALRRRDHRQRLRRANMRIMTRMGAALERGSSATALVRQGPALDRRTRSEPRFIMHFPEELAIKSFGSGYGGNALLGKKCHALRIASWPGAHRRLARRAHADRRPRRARRARRTTSPRPSRRPAARPTSRC